MVIESFKYRPSPQDWSNLFFQNVKVQKEYGFSYRDPLHGNGHRPLWIKALCEAMVIDFLCHIETLYEAMVIDLFTSIPSAKQWSLISYVTSRPTARQWSSISLHQDSLQSNGYWFLMSHWGPLRGNGHRSLYIKTLYKAMVIDFFPFDIDPLLGIGLICFSKKSEKKIIKQTDLSDREPLYMVMVTESFGYRPSPMEWSSLSSNLSSFETRTKLMFLSLLIFYYDNMKKSNFHII